jgi:hypothetical protein
MDSHRATHRLTLRPTPRKPLKLFAPISIAWNGTAFPLKIISNKSAKMRSIATISAIFLSIFRPKTIAYSSKSWSNQDAKAADWRTGICWLRDRVHPNSPTNSSRSRISPNASTPKTKPSSTAPLSLRKFCERMACDRSSANDPGWIDGGTALLSTPLFSPS